MRARSYSNRWLSSYVCNNVPSKVAENLLLVARSDFYYTRSHSFLLFGHQKKNEIKWDFYQTYVSRVYPCIYTSSLARNRQRVKFVCAPKNPALSKVRCLVLRSASQLEGFRNSLMANNLQGVFVRLKCDDVGMHWCWNQAGFLDLQGLLDWCNQWRCRDAISGSGFNHVQHFGISQRPDQRWRYFRQRKQQKCRGDRTQSLQMC